jgi:flagellar hook-associated protein 1 FlgK
MPWTFFGLELASRALQSMQLAMNTTGHNLANINTPGYSRQRVNLATTDPWVLQGIKTLFVGSGVRVDSIQRIRDIFLDGRIAATSSEYQRLNTLYQRLTQVEDTFGEPTDAGLSRQITAFFNAFQELSTNPENVGIRASVYQQAEGIARSFRQLASRLDEIFAEMNERVRATSNEINFIARSIADLNAKIRHNKALGTMPGDLLDARSNLIEKLSEYVGARTTEMSDGTVRISLGDFVLVEAEHANVLPDGVDYVNKRLTDGANVQAHVTGGSLRGLMDAMEYIRTYRARLDTLAGELVNRVNAIHETGYGLDGNSGYRLLEGTDALTIRVSDDVADINHIAAGNTDAPGDGNKALEIARLRQTPLAGLDNKTIPDYYNALVAELGEHTRSASIGQDNQKIILQNLQAEREAVSGVNMDEEMANLLRYQRSYQAAAHLVNVMDAAIADMLAALVGRR